MKIIFLDIDGVLNNKKWIRGYDAYVESIGGDEKIDHEERMWFDYENVENLNKLTNDTDAKIVISSSWRIGRSLEDLQTLLKEVGVTGEVIGKTPILTFANEGYSYSVPRGCEIKAWLESNKDILGDKISKTDYVILDDDSDMLYWQRSRFIWIDPTCGLSENTSYKAGRILNRMT